MKITILPTQQKESKEEEIFLTLIPREDKEGVSTLCRSIVMGHPCGVGLFCHYPAGASTWNPSTVDHSR